MVLQATLVIDDSSDLDDIYSREIRAIFSADAIDLADVAIDAGPSKPPPAHSPPKVVKAAAPKAKVPAVRYNDHDRVWSSAELNPFMPRRKRPRPSSATTSQSRSPSPRPRLHPPSKLP